MKLYPIVYLCWLMATVGISTATAQSRPKKVASTPAASTLAVSVADTSVYRVLVLARAHGDSIAVRWAPEQATLWRAALRGQGYLLTRRSIGPDGKYQLDYQKTIRPWTIDEWKRNAGPRDTLAGLCVQLLYGKRTDVDVSGGITIGKALRQHEQNEMALALALLRADVNPTHARGMGLGFLDKDVKKGMIYRYYVYPLVPPSPPVNGKPTGLPIELGQTAVLNSGPAELTRMIELTAEPSDRVVRVNWDRALTDNLFSAYYVERSTDGGRTFRRLTRRPWFQPPDSRRADLITYRDSTARNYQPYKYRVIGITPFGELSVPSPVLTVRSIDQTPPPLVEQVKTNHLGGNKVTLTWTYPKRPSDFAGFRVSKAMNLEGPFVNLHPKLLLASQQTFTDTTAIPYLPAFYRVTAVDTAGNDGPSLPIQCAFRDTQGPAKPKGLQGYIDTTGHVRVVWDANPEPDILGYTVVMANDPTHVFTPRTNGYLAVSVFNDTTTLQTLSRRLCFRVIAYDRQFNPSPPSDILTLTRPDRVPPGPPILTRYVASDTAMLLQWARSGSNDVREQILLRRGTDTERWHEVAKLLPYQTKYADKSVKPNTAYTYAMIAIDSAGLRSPVSPVLDLKTLVMTIQPIANLTPRLAADGKGVVLNWKYPNDLCRFVIYRAGQAGALRTYGSVNRESTFIDKAVQKGQYEYAVKVIYQDGRESGLSNRVKIDVN